MTKSENEIVLALAKGCGFRRSRGLEFGVSESKKPLRYYRIVRVIDDSFVVVVEVKK